MANPYNILGVSPGASDEEIDNAYLDLCEKYSTVNYQGSSLSGTAEDKQKEINDAYDQIMAERRVGKTDASGAYRSASKTSDGYTPYSGGNDGYQPYGSQGTSGSSGSYQSYGSQGTAGSSGSYQTDSDSTYTQNGIFAHVRALISQNNISAAEAELLHITGTDRGAEWNYLMGRVCEAKGWLDEASSYYGTAVKMQPNNTEFRSAANSFAARRSGRRAAGQQQYGGYNTTGNSSDCSACNICSSLICADCCCECMGGDLIRCC